MTEARRVVFLGCGYITGVHSRHLRRLRHLFIPGYASRDRDKAAAVALDEPLEQLEAREIEVVCGLVE